VEAEGTPISEQVPADCRRLVCDGQGQTIAEVDDSDEPIDYNPCTADRCELGVPSNVALPEGAPCGAGDEAGVCNAAGDCVGCHVAEDCCEAPGGCDGADCVILSCLEGVCETAFEPEGALGDPLQERGDCRQRHCDGAGHESSVVDDDDLPVDDGDDCTAQVCTSGTPSYPLAAENSPCAQSGGKVCTAAGLCVECNVVTQCTAPTSPCQSVQCLAHDCVVSNTAAGTLLDASYQTDQDCTKVVCDGNGNYTAVADTADVLPDGNDCTQDVCNGTTPAYQDLLPGVACASGGGQVCDGYGSCVECISNDQCTPPNTCGGGIVPNECGCTEVDPCVQHHCGSWSNGCFTVACNGVQDGDETDEDCGGDHCPRCELGKVCAVDSDCKSGYCVRRSSADTLGICCNGRCDQSCYSCFEDHTAQPDGSCLPVAAGGLNPSGNSDPWNDCASEDPSTCQQTGQCDGAGECALWDSSTECAPATCANNFLYRVLARDCDGVGNCEAPQQYSCGAYRCRDGSCLHSCVKTTTDCAPNFYCNNGFCVPT
jgi:hypothetical protein